MGIKSLHQILQEHAPDCYKPTHLSNYAFKKIAIDISLFLFKFKASAGDRWINSFIDLVNCLRKWDIHSIFIYDGKAPLEKFEEQQKRRESQSKQKDNIKELEKEIENYEKTGEAGNMMIAICKKEGLVSLFRKKDVINISIVKEKLEKMKNQAISITENDIIMSKKLFDFLKVPYIEAPAEAECFASILCVNGKVDAVLSEDTDVLAYGATVFLTKLDIYKGTVVEINFKDVLEGMDMTQDTFKDLCILLGCDYNSNVIGYGPKKSYELIKEYKNIEDVIQEMKRLDIQNKEKLKIKLSKEKNDEEKNKIQKKIDTQFNSDILKYRRCREMFSVPKEIDFYAPFCGVPDFEKLGVFLFENGINYKMETLKKNLDYREIIFDDVYPEES